MKQFLICFLLTEVIECAAVFWLKPRRKWLQGAFLGNLMTNPLLNAVLLLSAGRAYTAVLAAGELIAVAAEAWVYRMLVPTSVLKALGVSLFCNTLSFLLGLLLL